MLDCIHVGVWESIVGPTLVDPCPMGRRHARAGALVGHRSTNVGPTVDSYGPPLLESNQAYVGRTASLQVSK